MASASKAATRSGKHLQWRNNQHNTVTRFSMAAVARQHQAMVNVANSGGIRQQQMAKISKAAAWRHQQYHQRLSGSKNINERRRQRRSVSKSAKKKI